MAPTKEDVLSALRTCQDPEIPVNIVDLGLVYDVGLTPCPSGPDRSHVAIRMTLTSPSCPMSQSISGEVHRKLLELAGVESAKVEIVWEPSWNPEMITPEGKKILKLS
jgi:metal-sulfur cluster biosynthetic enzyme